MRLLLHELSTSKFAAEENAPTVDAHHHVPCLFGHFVYHAMVFSASYSSIVDHSGLSHLLNSLDRSRCLACAEALTHPVSLPT